MSVACGCRGDEIRSVSAHRGAKIAGVAVGRDDFLTAVQEEPGEALAQRHLIAVTAAGPVSPMTASSRGRRAPRSPWMPTRPEGHGGRDPHAHGTGSER